MDNNPARVGITNTDRERIKCNVIMNEESHIYRLLCVSWKEICLFIKSCILSTRYNFSVNN